MALMQFWRFRCCCCCCCLFVCLFVCSFVRSFVGVVGVVGVVCFFAAVGGFRTPKDKH